MLSRTVPLCVVFLLFAAFTPAQDAKKELEALQGDWTIVSLEAEGKKIDTQNKLTIKGDQWLLSTADPDDTSTIKIDPSKNPKTIDLTSKFKDKETVQLGIYKLDGDLLTICEPTGTARPTEFKSDKAILVVWKRDKK